MTLIAAILSLYSTIVRYLPGDSPFWNSILSLLTLVAKWLDPAAIESLKALKFQAANRPNLSNRKLFGFLEEAVIETVSGCDRLLVRGWLFHDDERIRLLSLRLHNGDIALVDYGLARADLASVFFWNENAVDAGFKGAVYLSAPLSRDQKVSLKIMAETTSRRVIQGEFESIPVSPLSDEEDLELSYGPPASDSTPPV